MTSRPYVDLLRQLHADGVEYSPWEEIAESRVWRNIEGVRVPVVGRKLLRRMKLATGRDKDLSDAALLGDVDD